MARAILSDPTFLLCDEPTGDLDLKSADEIMALIDELVGKYNKTILMVTNDPVVAARVHTKMHLEKGVLIEGGKSKQAVMDGGAVIKSPDNIFTLSSSRRFCPISSLTLLCMLFIF